jgi:hypothetical protein
MSLSALSVPRAKRAVKRILMQKKPQSYWIIGAGNFGIRAVERLGKKYPQAALTVVDQDQEALDRLGDLPVHRVCQEGASYLEAHLDDQTEPDWIIPAVPIHLAFEWVRRKLARGGRIEVEPVPPEIERMLPNPMRGMQGQLFASYADFLCPDNCTEPIDKCTFTGKPRKGLLYKKIEEISYKEYRSIVIQSRQLAAGVGGYQPEALKRSLAEVSRTKTPVLYTTACLCHGVMHAFRLV